MSCKIKSPRNNDMSLSHCYYVYCFSHKGITQLGLIVYEALVLYISSFQLLALARKAGQMYRLKYVMPEEDRTPGIS